MYINFVGVGVVVDMLGFAPLVPMKGNMNATAFNCVLPILFCQEPDMNVIVRCPHTLGYILYIHTYCIFIQCPGWFFCHISYTLSL